MMIEIFYAFHQEGQKAQIDEDNVKTADCRSYVRFVII